MEEPPTSKTLGYFFVILGGHAITLFGSSVVQFITMYWITHISTVFYFSVFTLLTFLPQIIITLFAGVLSDILNRKKNHINIECFTHFIDFRPNLSICIWDNKC